jgi:transposase InsO family protein
MKRKPKKSKEHKIPRPSADRKLGKVHSDICGPMSCTAGESGERYFITFIDDATRYVTVYLMKNKSEVVSRLKQFHAEMAAPESLKIGVLRTDGEEVYLSQELREYCKEKEILREVTPRYTPEANGVAERQNQTVVGMARAMLADAGLGNEWWGYATLHAAWLRNRCPSKTLGGRTPYEAWTGNRPTSRLVHAFGRPGWVFVPDALRTKWDQRAEKAIYVGVSPDRNCGMFYLLRNSTIVHTNDFELVADSTKARDFAPEFDSWSRDLKQMTVQKAERKT